MNNFKIKKRSYFLNKTNFPPQTLLQNHKTADDYLR